MSASASLVHVIQNYPPWPGGAECQARLLAALLAAEGRHCAVVTTRHTRALPAVAVEGGTRVYRLGGATRGAWNTLRNALRLAGWFLRPGRRFAAAHGHCLAPFVLIGLTVARWRGARTLVALCTRAPLGDVEKLLAMPGGRLLWALFRRVDRFVVPTADLVAPLEAHGVPAARIAVVPNFLPGDYAAPLPPRAAARAALGLPERMTVLFVGRLVADKGVALLGEIGARLAPRADVQLVVVGDGPERAALEARAAAEGWGARLRCVGWQEAPEPWYRSADVFVFPSRTEAFGSVIAEAMAHGLAVVTSPVGFVPGTVTAGREALVVAAREPAPWVAAVESLLDDAAAREALGARARAFALAAFEPTRLVRRYLGLYGVRDDGAPDACVSGAVEGG